MAYPYQLVVKHQPKHLSLINKHEHCIKMHISIVELAQAISLSYLDKSQREQAHASFNMSQSFGSFK